MFSVAIFILKHQLMLVISCYTSILSFTRFEPGSSNSFNQLKLVALPNTPVLCVTTIFASFWFCCFY